MGEGGFGPPKLKSNRFTVCPLWPLGNSPILIFKINSIGKTDRMELVDGLEPPTCWLQISCSTNWATPASTAVLLYHIFLNLSSIFWKFSKFPMLYRNAGRGDRTRTCGILVPNQALYQTELRLVWALMWNCQCQTALLLYTVRDKKSMTFLFFSNLYKFNRKNSLLWQKQGEQKALPNQQI